MARAVGNEMLAAVHPARRSGIQDLLASTSLAALVRAMPPVFLAAGLLIGAGSARANPQGGTVVSGSATIVATNPKRLDVDQTSNNAIIDWRSFSIGTGELVNFNQPGATSSTLNRVTSNEASVLEGQLTANGRVFLVNPNGVLISSTAQINVGGLVATTSDIANANFKAGKYAFDRAGRPSASIVNQGHITVRDAGLAAFVAPSVRNSGVIEARLGKVALASGNKFTLDLYGDNLVKLAVDDSVAASLPGARVDNSGKIIADGGTVTLTAAAARGIVDNLINVGGTIEARTASMQNGKIVLGGMGGTVQVSGTLDASGRGAGETGGTINVLGDQIGLRSGAKLDASGDAGGGTVLVGGNFHGAGPQPKASTTIVESGAAIAANAVTKGDGGRVAVWSEKLTGFAGSISARGGRSGGNGGFVETSSRQDLTAVGGSVDTRAPKGLIGTWLLDPHNITIATGGGAALPLAFGTTPATDVTIDPATLNAAASSVTLQANNDITLSNNIGLTAAGAGLTLQAGRSVLLNANITTTNGAVAIVANETAANGVVNANRDAGAAAITMAGGTSINAGNAAISLTLSTGAGLTNNTSGSVTLGSLTTTGTITVANNGPTAGGGISQTVGSALTAGGTSSFTDASTNGAITLSNAANALSGAVTLGTTGAGGNASLTNNAATTLAASTIGGNLAVTDSTGNLGQSGVLTVAGTSTFTNTANNGTITLTNVSNALTGAVSLNTTGAGGNASLTNDAAAGTALAASTIGGNLTVSAQQANLTQTGALTVGGASSFTVASPAFATIVLTNAGNAFTGAVTLVDGSVSGDVSLTNNAAAGTTLANSFVTGRNLVVVNTQGNLTQTGALVVSGTSSFTNSQANTTITLTNAANNLFGAVSLNTSGAGGNASLTDNHAGGTVLGASDVGGNLSVTSAQGNLTQTGALTVAGIASFTASAANATITLTNAGNQMTGGVALSTNGAAGDASLANAAAAGTVLAASNIGGNLTVTNALGSLAQTGALTVGGTSSFTDSAPGATIGLTNAGNQLIGAVALNTASGGDASLTNNAATTLAASTIGGNLSVTDSVGNLGQSGLLTVAGTSTFTNTATNGTITLAANAFTGAVSLNTVGVGGNASLTNNAATTLGASSVGGNLTVVDAVGNLGQSGALTVGGTSSFSNTAPNGTIALTNTGNALTGAVTLSTTGAGGNASLTNNAATLLAASTVGGNLTVTDTLGNLAQSGVLTVGGTSTFTDTAVNGTITVVGNALTGAVSLNTVGAGGNASLTNNAATTLGASSVGGNLTVVDTVGNLGQSGALTVGGTSSFMNAANGGTITLNAANQLTGAVALSTLGAGGNASVTNNAATTLAASSIGGNLSITDSTGNLGQSGVLTVAGTSTFTNTAANATITLNAANQLSGAVALNTIGTGGNANLTNNLATTLGTSTIGGSLTVTDTAGNLAQSGALTVGGTSSFTNTAGGFSITLTNAGNNLAGAVALSDNGNVSLTNNAAGGTTLAASNVGGSLTVVNTLGDLAQSGALVAGQSSFTNSAANTSIMLTNAGNNIFGFVSLNTSGASGNASLVNNSGSGTTFAASTVGGNLSLTNGSGNIAQSGALTVGGASSFTNNATDQSITLTNAGNTLSAPITLNTVGANGLASLTNAHATTLVTSSLGGGLTVIDSVGNLTQTGALTVGGASSFTDTAPNGTITLGASNLFRGAVSLNTTGAGGNATLSDFSGATNLAVSTIGGNLTVNMAGNLVQSGALTVAGTSSFADNAPGGSITLNGANSLTGTVALNTTGAGANASLTNNLATTLATSNVGGTLTVNAAGNIAQSGVLTVAGAASFTSTANNGTITLNGANLLTGAVTLNTTGANANASLTNSMATTLGTSTVGGNLAVANTAGDLTVAGNISAGQSVALTSANAIAQSGGGSITAGSVSLTASGASITASVAANTLTGSAASFATLNGSVGTLGSFTTHGAFTLADAMPAGLTVAGPINSNGGLITITNTGPINFPGAFQLTGDMSVAATGAGNNVTFASTVDGAHNLTVNAAGAAIFGGGVGQTTALASLTLGGAAHLGGGVATSGAQSYQGPVTLDADAALSGTTIAFASTIDGAHALRISGNASFGGRVGAGTALASLGVSGATALNGGIVTTTGAQNYAGPATLGVDNTLTASTVTFGSTLNGQHALVINGNAVFNGAVGSDPQVAPASLAVNGATTINGGEVTTLGSQIYNGPTTISGGLIVSDTSTLDFVGPLTLTAATTLGGTGITFGGGINGSSFATVKLGNFVGQLSFFQKEGIVTAITLAKKIDERFNRGDAAQTPAEQAFLNDPDRNNYAEDPYRKRYNILGVAAEAGASFNDISYVQDGFWEGLLK